MIVLIDQEKKQVTVSSESSYDIYNWNDLDSISKKISSKKVYYVTSAKEVEGNDVLSLLSKCTGKECTIIEKTGRLYLRSLFKGKLILRGQEEDLVFNNKIDFKSFAKFGGDPRECYPDLDLYLKSNKLEIVDECDIPRIKEEEAAKNKSKKNSSVLSTKEAEISKLIIDGSVDSLMSGDYVSDEDDGESIEITQSDLNSSRDMNSDVMDNLRIAGRSISEED